MCNRRLAVQHSGCSTTSSPTRWRSWWEGGRRSDPHWQSFGQWTWRLNSPVMVRSGQTCGRCIWVHQTRLSLSWLRPWRAPKRKHWTFLNTDITIICEHFVLTVHISQSEAVVNISCSWKLLYKTSAANKRKSEPLEMMSGRRWSRQLSYDGYLPPCPCSKNSAKHCTVVLLLYGQSTY